MRPAANAAQAAAAADSMAGIAGATCAAACCCPARRRASTSPSGRDWSPRARSCRASVSVMLNDYSPAAEDAKSIPVVQWKVLIGARVRFRFAFGIGLVSSRDGAFPGNRRGWDGLPGGDRRPGGPCPGPRAGPVRRISGPIRRARSPASWPLPAAAAAQASAKPAQLRAVLGLAGANMAGTGARLAERLPFAAVRVETRRAGGAEGRARRGGRDRGDAGHGFGLRGAAGRGCAHPRRLGVPPRRPGRRGEDRPGGLRGGASRP